MSVSARHEGDLNGQLVPFSTTPKAAVTLVLNTSAHLSAVQHTAWMMCNLLARLEGYIEQISICCPSSIRIHPNVFPFQTDDLDFGRTLVSATAGLNIVPVSVGQRVGMIFHIGPGPDEKGEWRAYGNAWIGGLTRSEVIHEPTSSLPFGPYVAACVAASEIFKAIRMRPEHYICSEGFYDTWKLQALRTYNLSEIGELPAKSVRCTLGGVGAVGTAFLHTMMACSTIELHARLADNDFKGVDVTNLNRYVLFGSDSVGKLKPNAACDLLRQEHLHLTPWNNSVEKLEPIGDRVLSAVDTNRAREGIQFRYPARIISASTSDLRAEVHRCGAPGKGACLRCYNPPEILPTDEELVLQLKKASGEEFAKICVGAGVSVETAKTWISTKRCGDEGERLLTFLREQDQGGGVFAVGFTSVLAGVLLATEFIKDCIGYKEPLNNSTNHAVFQFFEVLSGANESSFVAADVKCPACKSDRPGLPIWQGRFSALEPNR